MGSFGPMVATSYALFDTPIGRCAIAWTARGISCIQLPEARDAETRARLLRRSPGAREARPSAEVARVIAEIQALLSRKPQKLSRAKLDLEGLAPFHRRVYEAARAIPPGKTSSYGELAARLGSPGSARAVGQALGRNPFAIVVPCHRVLAAGGKSGGFSANGGVKTKMRLLALEGAALGTFELFDGASEFSFDTNEAVDALRTSDSALAALIEEIGPFRMRLEGTASVFGALAQAIAYQQLTGKAAATIFGRVTDLCATRGKAITAERVLSTADADLRAAGLSNAKVLSLKDLARKTIARELPTLEEAQGLDEETLIERLTTVRGIGRWTVEMFLMFRLGRPDVLPVHDYGIRKGFQAAFRKRVIPSPKQVALRGERWKPYRTVASWYLWRAAERAREKARV